jgi:hypothetical protein
LALCVCVCICVCVCVCLCSISLSFRCLVLCILNNVNVHQICRTLSLSTWRILRLGGQRILHVVYITGIYYNFFSSCYYYYHYCLLYAGYPYTYSRDKLCP